MSSLSDLSVLIVDPNPGMRGNLHNMLSQASITKIDYAVSAGTAIRQLGKKSFDLILCEYDLDVGSENGQDGQQLLEDLRHHRLIDPSTIFIMLTSEGVHSKVMGAAELAPTDYVLKPFTVEGLLQRIARAVDRRNALLPVYRHAQAGNLRDAIAACAGGAVKQPRYAGDFIRLRAELHAQLGEWSDAESIYQEILASRATGWAQLGLARCQLEQGRPDDARQTLEQLIAENPRFMAAYDLLAADYAAMGQATQAKRVLEDAVAISPHVVRRLRQLGELALESDDIVAAERAFRQVVAKAKYSEFRDPQDHVNLVRTLVRRGDATQAAGVIRDLERSLRSGPNTEACRAYAASLVQELGGNDVGAASELTRAVGAVQAAQGLSGRLKRDIVQGCLRHRLDGEAATVVLHMMNDGADALTADEATDVFEKAGRHDLAVAVRKMVTQQVDALVSDAAEQLDRGDHRGAVATITAAVRRTPGNVPVLIAAARTVLRQLDDLGWEAPLGEQAANLLARLRTLDPANGALDHLTAQYVATQRKYGIAAHG
ncbi:tetratricopeptide repeat protein [Pseudoduganella flava]|uniref:Tetratricopeptide repeat protein n=2 Tax=Pseudoduganella flava TaxID=871742 RepID=A0A562PQD4_9BURK|nr:response regulator [Pseudoduganella flava]QGZ37828.1 tetratricopeptide repeat protein [Pseudoduganella flava]TWI46652.1 tetratricopeptide repeat protein [Pseudoduganella flava]